MAVWTAPTDFTNGQLVTETQMDIISENCRYLKGTGGLAVDLDTAALGILGDYKTQATSPALWLDQTGTNAGGARWVLNSGALQLQRRAAGYGAATTTPIIFIDMVNAAANTMRMGANGVSINLAAASLSALDVAGGVAIGSYAGANAAPSNGLIVSGAAGFGYASPAAGSVCVSGKIGVGTNAPTGPLDVRDGVGGFRLVTFTITDNSSLSLLPAGVASTAVAVNAFAAKASVDTIPRPTSTAPSGLPLIWSLNSIDQQLCAASTTGTADTLLISIAASGAVTMRRGGTSPTATWRGTFLLSWL